MTTVPASSPSEITSLTRLSPSKARSWASVVAEVESKVAEKAAERPRHRYATNVSLWISAPIILSEPSQHANTVGTLKSVLQNSLDKHKIDVSDGVLDVRILDCEKEFSFHLDWNTPVRDTLYHAFLEYVESTAGANEIVLKKSRELLSKLQRK